MMLLHTCIILSAACLLQVLSLSFLPTTADTGTLQHAVDLLAVTGCFLPPAAAHSVLLHVAAKSASRFPTTLASVPVEVTAHSAPRLPTTQGAASGSSGTCWTVLEVPAVSTSSLCRRALLFCPEVILPA
ncbi:hypothetical protein LDENG_00009240 [Lucifuga dentata]|nr:hypothetical protein LDENG_00009240 [Lucifuga dentata]